MTLTVTDLRAAIDRLVAAMERDFDALDSLDAMARAAAGLSDPDAVADAVAEAAGKAQAEMRDKPATVGRARIFGEKTIGMDDPGMLAMTAIVAAITGRG